jgi:hypothetical protein
MNPDDQKFYDDLHAKLYVHAKSDRAAQTAAVVAKVGELAHSGQVRVSELPADVSEKLKRIAESFRKAASNID